MTAPGPGAGANGAASFIGGGAGVAAGVANGLISGGASGGAQQSGVQASHAEKLRHVRVLHF